MSMLRFTGECYVSLGWEDHNVAAPLGNVQIPLRPCESPRLIAAGIIERANLHCARKLDSEIGGCLVYGHLFDCPPTKQLRGPGRSINRCGQSILLSMVSTGQRYSALCDDLPRAGQRQSAVVAEHKKPLLPLVIKTYVRDNAPNKPVQRSIHAVPSGMTFRLQVRIIRVAVSMVQASPAKSNCEVWS